MPRAQVERRVGHVACGVRGCSGCRRYRVSRLLSGGLPPLGDARRALGDPPVLALTATATEDVVREILTVLRVPDAAVINTGTARDNIFLSVFPTVNNDAKLARILSLIISNASTRKKKSRSIHQKSERPPRSSEASLTDR